MNIGLNIYQDVKCMTRPIRRRATNSRVSTLLIAAILKRQPNHEANAMPNILRFVSIEGQKAFTTSLIVAEACQLSHQNVIRLIKKFQTDFEEFGPCGFEIRMANRKQGGGLPLEYAILNEDQATYLITLFRNTPIVRKFKVRLVKEFRKALNRIAKEFGDPPREDLLTAKRKAHHPMMDALIEMRAEQGKTTDERHFMSENKLCNWAVTGRFAAIDEKSLSNEDADLLARIRRLEESMINLGFDYDDRKEKIREFAEKQRKKRLN